MATILWIESEARRLSAAEPFAYPRVDLVKQIGRMQDAFISELNCEAGVTLIGSSSRPTEPKKRWHMGTELNTPRGIDASRLARRGDG
jgi:hypothetical protein